MPLERGNRWLMPPGNFPSAVWAGRLATLFPLVRRIESESRPPRRRATRLPAPAACGRQTAERKQHERRWLRNGLKDHVVKTHARQNADIENPVEIATEQP